MAKIISDYGKRQLFSFGWRSRATKVRLYTSAGIIIDEQDITFIMDTQSGTMYLSTPVIFNVPSGTTNVSQVRLFSFGEPDVYDLLYTEDLASYYDFTTAGTLTLDTYYFDISSSSITVNGKNRLWNNGWVQSITFGKLIKGTSTLIDTKACAFEISYSTNRLELESPLVFTVPADPTNLAYTIHLGYTDGETDKIVFKKVAGVQPYPTSGTHTTNTWGIGV